MTIITIPKRMSLWTWFALKRSGVKILSKGETDLQVQLPPCLWATERGVYACPWILDRDGFLRFEVLLSETDLPYRYIRKC